MALGDAFYETSQFDSGKPPSLDRLDKLVGNNKWLRDQAVDSFGVKGGILRTAPGGLNFKSKVQLTRATEIRLSDGRKIPLNAPIEADITVSGAGGLDTGTEVASRWFQPYVIAKNDGTYSNGAWSSPPTTSLILKKYRAMTLDQSQTSGATGSQGINDAAARTYLAQSFTAGATGYLPLVELMMSKTGTPAATSDVYIEIQSNNAGSPSGTVLGTSIRISAARWITNNGFNAFVFDTPVSLTSGTVYWIVLKSTYTADGANYLTWYYSDASGYGGAGKRWDGAAWQVDSASRDYAHKTYYYLDETPTLTLPSGYTGFTKAGPPVYNNASSDFQGFFALDGMVTPLQLGTAADPGGVFLGATGATLTPILFDVSTVLPPDPVIVYPFFGSAGNQYVWVGPVPDGQVLGTGEANYLYYGRFGGHGSGASLGATLGSGATYPIFALPPVWCYIQRLIAATASANDIRVYAENWQWRG